MYKCIKLIKKNLKYFRELNSKRTLFNSLNKDFFQVYDNCNFIQKMILRNKVKLIKNNVKYIGYIWTDIYNKNVCYINAMNVLYGYNNMSSLPYKYLINTIKENCIIRYLCENNDYNFKLLKSVGFEKKEGTLILYKELPENMHFILNRELEFEMLQKGKDEGKRCEIQNKIFQEDNRVPLTLEDIFFDEVQDYYFEKGAVFLKKNNEYIGYGQFIIENGIPVIVNFGIIKEFRGKGYSKFLLMYILKLIHSNGFNKIIIKVKNSNYIALNLYKSVGFEVKKEQYYLELRHGDNDF
ncbi:GNAT family N-acetyltransferase [Clostridium sp. MT-14]|uniref:GNAT family N-acetyltransferase n=1 Tax=unclassified Clostridium TaxID=2614128 RepID=UPI00123B3A08|nr:GNAT family N-acetyltransferase [Clostridium sp. HV4-5-A1G]KAA8664558.1 GNAT family N-acetyltransferase [Clostridium sp. HV4-5-A1G]CAB1245139.1 Acetyltransferase [Clostridiaceae bacterium BL-3]